ncbi:MAG: hypothetical protein AAGF79_06435 [Pseudomonadota bacterium]
MLRAFSPFFPSTSSTPSTPSRLKARVTAGATALLIAAGSPALADTFRDVTGTWEGTYKAAFSKSHPRYPDQMLDTEVELEIYRQEENLIWVEKRWRRGTSEWVVEYGTGSFNLDERDELVIVEESPPPQDWINTGFLIGEYDDGELHLVYAGPGDGVSYAVSLKRKR